nr:NAD-dependent succinate-semialdehyde dehydrogenase [Acinetobacter sp. Marseille-Q1620]
MYPNTQLLINNQWKDAQSKQTIAVLNPANGQEIGHVAKASIADLDEALLAAQSGYKLWSKWSAYKRAGIMRKAATILRERADLIAEIMTQEQGKPLVQARGETLAAVDVIEWFAGEAQRVYGQIVPARQTNVINQVFKVPVGPVAAFTPWNFPINQVVRKLSAAIAAGCSIIVKGPEDTPASTAELFKAFIDAGIPDGVINLVFGEPAEISEYLIPHPIIRKISFTGSTAVGKKLASLAGLHMKKCTMELGGHAPVLIFNDADLDKAAEQLAAAKFRNSGQVCIAPTRFLIEKNVFDSFVEKFKQAVVKIKIGNGLDADVDMGPMIHQRAWNNVQKLTEDALNKGANLVYQADVSNLEKGYFVGATILSQVPLDARCMNEEPFGPLAICQPFERYEDAVSEANRLAYGLAAYAYTTSQHTATALGQDIETGMLAINHLGLALPEVPFGGVKDSGYGTEGGSEAIQAYLDTRFVTVAT